ncbi:MAG: TrmB family transcriptional regulator [Candidatus Hodarchaeales archaeon]|jgi:sugar-specific transcriptional regulator TrmB
MEEDLLTSISPALKDALREFGLTDYEVRAYIALIEDGEATANLVSDHSGVPYTRVYDVLKELEEKRFVEVRRGRPSTYRPRPPSEATALFIEKINQELQKNQKQIILDLKPLYEKKYAQEHHDVVIVRGTLAVLEKIRDTLENVGREILILGPVIAEEYINYILPSIANLRAQNIRVRVLLTTGNLSEIPELPEEIRNTAEIRIAENLPGAGILVDRKILFFITQGTREEKNGTIRLPLDAQVVGLWIDLQDIVGIAAEWVDKLWNSLPDFFSD